MYPITRESVMAAISSKVAEKAVCWCEGRKKRNRRILRRLTHSAVAGRVIGGVESGRAIQLRRKWGTRRSLVPGTPHLDKEESIRQNDLLRHRSAIIALWTQSGGGIGYFPCRSDDVKFV